MSALWHVLQTTDSTFPVGGFAHSYGLEGLVQAERITAPEELERFLQTTWLNLLTFVDFPLIRLSRDHAMNNDAIFRLDELAGACRTTGEARKAQQQMGRQRLKLVADLSRHPRLIELNQAADDQRWMANWPVVWGVEASALDLPMDQHLMAFGYQSINGMLAASAKLIRIGPTEIQRILYGCKKGIEEAIPRSGEIGEEDIGWFTPLLDITGACHETAYTRLFMS